MTAIEHKITSEKQMLEFNNFYLRGGRIVKKDGARFRVLKVDRLYSRINHVPISGNTRTYTSGKKCIVLSMIYIGECAK